MNCKEVLFRKVLIHNLLKKKKVDNVFKFILKIKIRIENCALTQHNLEGARE